MSENKETTSWMNTIPPKTLFFGGIIGGILVLCTIGFFILLGMTLSKGGGDYYPTPAGNTGDTAQAPTGDEPAVGKPAAVTNEDHIAGAANGKVTLIEYSDFQCPFCQRFHPTIEKLVNDYKGKIRWVYRNFPLDSIHPQAINAAQAAECVASLKGNDAYWKYSSLLFDNQSSFSESLFSDLATRVGVNKSAFDSCYKSGKFLAKIKASQSEGESIGVQGTPATFVVAADGSVELIGGALPYDQAKAYVDRALAK